MHLKGKLTFLAGCSILFTGLFVLTDAGGNWGYVLPRRGIKILAMILTGISIAISTVIFQTITNNRILTPSIMGLDSLYVFIQTFVIFVFGSAHRTLLNPNINFAISVGMMLLFSSVLYKVMFKREGRNIFFLLLTGIILGTFFQSLSTFMQVLIDPNEFQVVQDKMFASFNNVSTELLVIAIVAVLIIGVYMTRLIKYLDVLSLGREQAINLGVPYDHMVKRLLMVIAILVSISTALVGPIMFLGLLVANVAYEFLQTHKHTYLLIGSSLVSIIALIGGQFIVERVFTFSTTLSVIVNFVGGVYFIYLLLRVSKS